MTMPIVEFILISEIMELSEMIFLTQTIIGIQLIEIH